jgi:hypothetical protein
MVVGDVEDRVGNTSILRLGNISVIRDAVITDLYILQQGVGRDGPVDIGFGLFR